MKRYITILMMALLAAGCSFLDKEPDDMKTDKMVWSNRNEVLKYLTNCYAALPMDNLHQDDPWLGCSDECDIPWAVYRTYGINLGQWEPSTDFYVRWGTWYKAIRATFVLEENVDRCQELSEDIRTRYKGEALFLRAFYYYLLLRQYGPVVFFNERQGNSTDFGSLPRTPFDECVNGICDLLDRAETMLPISYASEPENKGRATVVACRAVKSTVLLLAASPQWNGNVEYADFKNQDGTPLVNTVYDEGKWKRAADAAKAVIELAEEKQAESGLGLYVNAPMDSPEFNPYKSYYDLFNNGWNSEIIWGSIDQGTVSWDNRGVRYAWMIHTIPTGINCMGAVGPTLRLVDAFYMENGRTIDDPASGYIETGFAVTDGPHYNPHKVDQKSDEGRKTLIADLKNLDAWGHSAGDRNMFCNREARFYASVNYCHRVQLTYSDDATIRNKYNKKADQQDGYGRVEFYYGGTSNSGENLNYPMTGFLTQKRVVPCDFYNNTMPGKYVSLYIRYAQVLLDYIEALNEYDPGNADIRKYWDQIRRRAGLPSIYETYPEILGDKDQQREYILRERQVELNFEGDRYFTVRRRWLAMTPDEGGAVDNRRYGEGGRVWGLAVRGGNPSTNNFKSDAFYTRTAFETRVFKKEYYLFPIPQSEIDKSPALVQNPWW